MIEGVNFVNFISRWNVCWILKELGGFFFEEVGKEYA